MRESASQEQHTGLNRSGVMAALSAAFLFGAGTPLVKWLLAYVNPWWMAGLLYLGSGIGLGIYRLIRRPPQVRLTRAEFPWLIGAVVAGGVVGPVLLMFGLVGTPASSASLLLNAEGVLTALLAWFVFRENFDRRIATGMIVIVVGAIILSWPEKLLMADLLPSLAVLGACLAWAVDNNFTRKISLADETWIAVIKGLVAGTVNVVIAMTLNPQWPSPARVVATMVLGLFSYGVSLALFVVGLRNLGTARTGAYFSIAPFFGAVISLVFLRESVTLQLVAAGLCMGIGIWLHLTEHHSHEHVHIAMMHTHSHVHDPHHQHTHDTPLLSGSAHSHPHEHASQTHSHPHFPDAHHLHPH